MTTLKIGDLAPSFYADGFNLEDFKGKILVLYFYPKDDTPGCTIEAKEFSQNKAIFDSLGAKILGVSVRENLDMRDGFFVNDENHQLKVIKMIRKYQPEIVLCNAIQDRHIDHGKGSKLVSDACFLSGLIQIKTEINGEAQRPWRPKVVYHYIQWQTIEPNFVVDISDFMTQKMESVQAYSSQFYDPNSKEPVTPIASKNFLESIHYRAKDLGRLVGVEYAEGFTVERYLTVNSLGDLK